MKLKTKERVRSRVKKSYERAQTPYSRVLAAPQVSKQRKQQLRAKYETLNPAALRRKLNRYYRPFGRRQVIGRLLRILFVWH
jgi:hypothetical protein